LPSRSLPNFIIVGVSRAGTTSVFNALSAHPQICPSTTKETRYFQPVRYGEPLAPIAEYQSFFRRYAGQPVTMECTPDYFYGGAATAKAIKDICDPRITIILREPISRLVSFYRFMQARLQIPAEMSLSAYVDRCQTFTDAEMNQRANNVYTGLWTGQYARFLPAWLAAYRERCDVFFFDDLVADPDRLLAEQCERLGIDPDAVHVIGDLDNTSDGFRSRAAQRVAARAARHSRALFRRYPALYTHGRRAYEAMNQRATEPEPVPAALLREITAIYQPWNDLLGQQLADAGVDRIPDWVNR